MPDPSTVVKTVESGDLVSYETKNPFTTFRIWGLLTLAITFFVDKAVAAGKLPEVFRDPVIGTILEVLGYGGGFLATFYGSWNAKRPLGFGDTPTPAKEVS